MTMGSKATWRRGNVGRLLNNAVHRFEARVLEVMGEQGHSETRMAHISLTRNLDIGGTRLTELARRAEMTKQAMGELVDQCMAMGLVDRMPDPNDRRARIVTFTPDGIAWLEAFRNAVDVAEGEMRAEIGPEVMDALLKGLNAYAEKFGTLTSE